jgi:hypothetical protein
MVGGRALVSERHQLPAGIDNSILIQIVRVNSFREAMLPLAETLAARLYAICVQPESLYPHSEISAEAGADLQNLVRFKSGLSLENLRAFICFLQVDEIIDNGKRSLLQIGSKKAPTDSVAISKTSRALEYRFDPQWINWSQRKYTSTRRRGLPK